MVVGKKPSEERGRKERIRRLSRHTHVWKLEGCWRREAKGINGRDMSLRGFIAVLLVGINVIAGRSDGR